MLMMMMMMYYTNYIANEIEQWRFHCFPHKSQGKNEKKNPSIFRLFTYLRLGNVVLYIAREPTFEKRNSMFKEFLSIESVYHSLWQTTNNSLRVNERKSAFRIIIVSFFFSFVDCTLIIGAIPFSNKYVNFNNDLIFFLFHLVCVCTRLYLIQTP